MFDMLAYRLQRPYHWLRTGLLEGVPAQLRHRGVLKGLTIVAITGTDGKTTTSSLIYHLLNQAGRKTGLISTVGGYVADQVLDTGLHVTSPAPRQLYRLLALMKQQGCTHVVLETTSHGLYQYRFWGIHPQIAGVTNITHEHLDYHRTWEEYAKAKLLILHRAPSVYYNEDDQSRGFFQRQQWSKRQTIHRYGAATTLPKIVQKSLQQRFAERYNRLNATLACLIAQELGVTDVQIAAGLSSFPGVPGRMEVIAQKPVKVIVDFAHTPNALEQVLRAIRATLSPPSRLIVVFGCAGLRDVQKRPLMGEIGASLADLAVFTAEDPRTEDIWSIFRQMKSGITQNHNRVATIADREAAIRFAIKKLAKPGDCVVLCGKGHEQSLCIGNQEYPWSDKATALSILKEAA